MVPRHYFTYFSGPVLNYMKNRIYLFIAFLLGWVNIIAQTSDPVELFPYQFKGHINQLFSGNRKNYTYDSSLMVACSLNDLNYTLGAIFPVYLKNYGNGMSSGISLRALLMVMYSIR